MMREATIQKEEEIVRNGEKGIVRNGEKRT